eukprot:TRINITY_DN19285_c0_g1_i3.p1 TRINITY_DN19285_c0_g1~~TRINITY_DN19285_c0_g1_i3.p1  ORF type:complete len:119 (+),score=38.18 TRINITY_DN19285_c0_g1_i3:283-639(+)
MSCSAELPSMAQGITDSGSTVGVEHQMCCCSTTAQQLVVVLVEVGDTEAPCENRISGIVLLAQQIVPWRSEVGVGVGAAAVSYTHLRAHETPEHLVCRLLLEKKKKNIKLARQQEKLE